MDLIKLLKPKSIAVIGANEKAGFGGDTCRNIMQYRKDLSRVYFIHPTRETVFGQKCYRSIADVKDNIDLAIICTSQKTIIPLLHEIKAKGCGGAVVYASGYSEVGTEEGNYNEAELIRTAQELDIAIMGPNCGGFINFIDDVYGFAFTGDYGNKKGSVGFVSQSGQFCIDMMNSFGMKYSYAISAGNSRVVMVEDYLEFLIEDKDTRVIAVYLEGVNDPQKFELCLRKATQQRKPFIVLKAGRSPKGRATAASHTGSMAGSDQTYDAIFKKFGIIRVDDMQDLKGTAATFSDLKKLPEKPNFASICLSGGETGICADIGYLYGIDYPDLEEATLKHLRQLLPSYATPRNPLDMTAMLAYDSQEFADGICAIMQDPNIEMGFIGWTISDNYTQEAEVMFQGIKLAAERVDKPLAIMSFMEASRNKKLVKQFEAAQIPVLPTTKYAFSILSHLRDFINYDASDKTLYLALPEQVKQPELERINLSEHESKKMLEEYGVAVPYEIVATSEDEVVAFGEQYGYPLAMKIESPDILHKSDIGGVILDIKNAKEAKEAYNAILKNAKAYQSEARVNGILVQKMQKKGIEVIVGVNNDKQFGPMVMVGLGGVFVEIFKDAALYPAPLNQQEALDMIESLKAFKLLNGYRGGKVYDIEALSSFIVDISHFAVQNKDHIAELDINPLFVYEKGEGIAVIDALIILNKKSEEVTT